MFVKQRQEIFIGSIHSHIRYSTPCCMITQLGSAVQPYLAASKKILQDVEVETQTLPGQQPWQLTFLYAQHECQVVTETFWRISETKPNDEKLRKRGFNVITCHPLGPSTPPLIAYALSKPLFARSFATAREFSSNL